MIEFKKILCLRVGFGNFFYGENFLRKKKNLRGKNSTLKNLKKKITGKKMFSEKIFYTVK